MYEDYFKSIIGGNIKSPEYYVSTYDNKTYEPIQVNTLPGYTYSSSNEDIYQEQEKIQELYPDVYKIISPMVDKLLEGKDAKDVNETMLVNWTVEIYDALEVDDENTKLVSTNSPNPVSNNVSSNGTNTTTYNNSSLNKLNNANATTYNANSLNSTNVTNNNGAGSLRNNVTPVSSQTMTQGNTRNNVQKMSNNITDSRTDLRNIVDTHTITTDEIKTVNAEPKIIDVVSRYRNYRNPLLRDLIRILILNKIYGNQRPPRPMPRPYQDFRPVFAPMPDYGSVNTEIYKPYTNYSKTYFDTPYPEE